MKPTKQTILHDPLNNRHGNCLPAVLASLLHIPIENVPIFATPGTWVKDLNTWLRPFGLAYCLIEDFECQIDAYGIEGLWHEVSGNTTRNKEVKHACVAKDGEFVFDPHPDDSGLTKVTCHGFFIALEPWRWSELTKASEPACEPTIERDTIAVNLMRLTQGLDKNTARLIADQCIELARQPAPKREWVGLTDEQLADEWEKWRASLPRYLCFAKAIQAKLKELNHG
jgi:hypothetical protein